MLNSRSPSLACVATGSSKFSPLSMIYWPSTPSPRGLLIHWLASPLISCIAEPATCPDLGGESAAVEAAEVLGVPSVDRFSGFTLLSLLAAKPWPSAWVIPLPVILNLLANLLLVLVAVAFMELIVGFFDDYMALEPSKRAFNGICREDPPAATFCYCSTWLLLSSAE